jgi:hypothetical protein
MIPRFKSLGLQLGHTEYKHLSPTIVTVNVMNVVPTNCCSSSPNHLGAPPITGFTEDIDYIDLAASLGLFRLLRVRMAGTLQGLNLIL